MKGDGVCVRGKKRDCGGEENGRGCGWFVVGVAAAAAVVLRVAGVGVAIGWSR